MVQRYDQGNYCGGEYPCEMKEVGSGEFVEYFEYRNLKASHDKLVKKLRIELCRTELVTISKKFIYEALKEAEKKK